MTLLAVFHLDIDANTSRHLQSCQSIHSFLCRSDDIDQSFMSSLLKLFSGIFVFVYGSQKTVDALSRLEMPAGVYIDIKMKNK